MPSTPKAPADPIDARLVRRLADSLIETGRRRAVRAIDAIRLTLQGLPIPI